MSQPGINIEVAERMIMLHGPTRVIVSGDGEATTEQRARRDYGIVPDIIFIREDGWSLGAPSEWESLAHKMWQKDWVGFMRRPTPMAKPIRQYKVVENDA